MISIATVCDVYDEPAIPIRMQSGQSVLAVRAKSLDTGRLMTASPFIPTIHDGKPYAILPDFAYGERVAVAVDLISMDDVEAWLSSDEEVPYRDWLLRPSKTQETPSEAPRCDDTREDAELGLTEVVRCR